MAPSRPVKVFISYAHEDEELRKKLEAHLAILRRQRLIEIWQDREIGAGTEWAGTIHNKLETADLILLLVSADFLNSDYSFDVELQRAMELHEAKTARVIPIILRPCFWQDAPFAKLQALPTNGEAVTSSKWSSVDVAFRNIAEGVERTAKELFSKIFTVDVGPDSSTTAQLGGSISQMPKAEAKQLTEERTDVPGWDDDAWTDPTFLGPRKPHRKPAKR